MAGGDGRSRINNGEKCYFMACFSRRGESLTDWVIIRIDEIEGLMDISILVCTRSEFRYRSIQARNRRYRTGCERSAESLRVTTGDDRASLTSWEGSFMRSIFHQHSSLTAITPIPNIPSGLYAAISRSQHLSLTHPPSSPAPSQRQGFRHMCCPSPFSTTVPGPATPPRLVRKPLHLGPPTPTATSLFARIRQLWGHRNSHLCKRRRGDANSNLTFSPAGVGRPRVSRLTGPRFWVLDLVRVNMQQRDSEVPRAGVTIHHYHHAAALCSRSERFRGCRPARETAVEMKVSSQLHIKGDSSRVGRLRSSAPFLLKLSGQWVHAISR